MSYNVFLTTPKPNTIAKHVVFVVTTKSSLTCANCGKIGHTFETCHNKKIEVPIVPTAIIKSIKPITKTKPLLVKLVRIPICYPCIIYYSLKHRFGECPKKIKVQNMFKIKFVNFNATIAPKLLKLDNVPINVVAIATTHSQQLLKEKEPVKVKGTKDWQQKERLQDSFIETLRQIQCGRTKK